MNLARRIVFQGAGYAIYLALGASNQVLSDSPARPNILWIIAEDMGPELGCYGTQEVSTPTLDNLANAGMRYRNAFTVTPVCSTSRSSFMTGMYAMAIDAHNHRSHRDGTNPLPDGVQVLTDWLRPHGYATANLVKLTDDPQQAKFFKGTGKNDWNFTYPEGQQPFDLSDWETLKTNQPFYAQVNFSETHRGHAWNTAHKQIEHPADPKQVVIPPYYPDHPVTRAVWAQYLNAVMAVDKKVAFILDLLRRDELDKNTVVVFMTDHGRAMPRGKQWPYDSGLQIPLIVYWPEGNSQLPLPRGYRRGAIATQLVSSIDIAATTLALAGIAKPPAMQGRVLLGEAMEPPREYVFGGRDRGDETVFHIRTVRDQRFRYLRNKYPERPFLLRNCYKERSYPIIGLLRDLHKKNELTGAPAMLLADSRPQEELYDLANDPWEIKNLADDPAYADQKRRLAQALDDWMEEINDQGRDPESAAEIKPWKEEQDRRFETEVRNRPPDWYLKHPALGPYRRSSRRSTAKEVFRDDFETGTGGWSFLDPGTWRRSRISGNAFLEITARESEYQPPVRSPRHVALIKDVEVGDFELSFRVRSTKDTGNHRDCCVFFGYQDERHFYYVHLGAVPDPASGQIMIVNDADRAPLTENTRKVAWDDQWHLVKVERRLADGTINVYFDDMRRSHMTVQDKTFGRGRVGIGSFDDLNAFDDVVLLSE